MEAFKVVIESMVTSDFYDPFAAHYGRPYQISNKPVTQKWSEKGKNRKQKLQ